MIVEPDYRGYRIEIEAERRGDRWDAVVRIQRTLCEAKPHVDHLSFGEVIPDIAERRGLIWAKRWVEMNRTG